MSVEIGLLIAIIGCFVGLAGWLAGRDKKLSKDSEWRGTVNTKLDLAIGIRKDHEELREEVSRQGNEIVALKHDLQSLKNHVSHLHKLD
jgi:hypothetical protein